MKFLLTDAATSSELPCSVLFSLFAIILKKKWSECSKSSTKRKKQNYSLLNTHVVLHVVLSFGEAQLVKCVSYVPNTGH